MGVAEELRALAGAWDEWGLGGKLTELAERLERQEVVSDEDAEAARWVREHGGVGFLEIHLPNLWSFIDHIMDRLGVDKSDIDGPELVDEELDRRLMPPGYEWPRFDDGEKVKFGEVGLDVHGKRRSAEGIKFTQGGFTFVSDDMGDTWWGNDSGPIEDPSVDYSKRVKRPKPAPVGADGLPIKKGEAVRGTGRSQHDFEVLDTHDINPEVGSRFSVKCFDKNDGKVCWCDPALLTHTKPEPQDSWEQLEEDAGENPFDYCKKVGHHLFTFDNADEFKSSDLLRRAKALADRERGDRCER